MFRSNEQQNFYKLIAKHIAEKDAPLLLEGGTGLGKTRAYLAAVAECNEKVAIVLPTHQLIDQLISSTDLVATNLDVVAFRPAHMFETRADYMEHRAKAIESRVMLCTNASVVIDQRLRGGYNAVVNRNYLLFDEADQLPNDIALQRNIIISANDLKEAGVKFTTVEETLQKLIAKPELEAEVRARAILIAESVNDPAWYLRVGKTDDEGIKLDHELPGRLLKRISNQNNVAFISATLSIGETFDDFRRGMGIGEISRFSETVEPEAHGEIQVETPIEANTIEIVDGAERPCLVATTSHDSSIEIGSQIADAVVRRQDETTSEAAARVPENGVLIAAGAWAGLDTPIRWASIVVPRVPFDRPTVLDDNVESRYIDSRNVAVRRMRQVVGRGLRSPDAVCTIYILDERYTKLGQFLPKRFKECWQEGARDTLVLSKVERDPAVRRAALKHYGIKCQACGLEPSHQSVIDIHHLDPIAEGERQTTLEDVIPLCANCHRTAHTRKPPIPIAELQGLLKA